MFSNIFIKRPRFAVVISLIIMLLGIISMTKLPLEEYPSITPPQIVVRASYPGANAEVIESTVAAPIESAVNGVEDMIYMQSDCSNGGYSLSIFFKVGADPDKALVNVQNRLQLANAQLPEDVKRFGLIAKEKTGGPGAVLISLFAEHDLYDDIFLSNYASIHLKDTLSRIDGVGDIEVFGAKDYGMRIWLKPDKMANLGVTPTDVANAIRTQNVQIAVGNIGQEPIINKQKLQFILRTKGRLTKPNEFENIIVRSKNDGSSIKVKDIARVELGAQSYGAYGRVDGKPIVILSVKQVSDANTIQVVNDIKAELKKISKSFPEGIKYEIIRDETTFVKKSLREVAKSILISIFLVTLITYIFLGDKRSTLVPLFAIPVSLIGTFSGLAVMGMSINLLTLLGLVLAVGTVVDDAIVVIENVQRHITEGLSPKEATKQTMEEIGGAVIATTLVLLAVFVPVGFLPGITGMLYKQFAIGIAVAVSISTLAALTLAPALCSTIIRNKQDITPNKYLLKFNYWFTKLTEQYLNIAKYFIERPKATIITIFSILVMIGILYTLIPKGFIPKEDKGVAFTQVLLPDGTSLSKTDEVTKKAEAIALGIKGVKSTTTFIGFGGTNSGFVISTFDDWEKRKHPSLSSQAIVGQLNQKISSIPEAMAMTFTPPSIPGLGYLGGLELQVQDMGDNPPQYLDSLSKKLMMKAQSDKNLFGMFSTFQANVPHLLIEVDEEKALAQNISLQELYSTLSAQFGSLYINDFNKLGRVFKVQIQADSQFRETPDDIYNLFVRNNSGEMVPINTVVNVKNTVGPASLSRFNMFRSVTMNARVAPWAGTGEGIKSVKQILKEELPSDTKYEWSGTTRQEVATGNQAPIIIALALLFVYLFLVALYESWTIPFAVILVSPVAVMGALFAQFVAGYQFDLYSQMGVIMLIGLSTKQAVLIVEFAKIQREAGFSIVESALTAAKLRFRAVIMTVTSFILGVMPLVLAFGAGSESRKSIGITVFGGMIAAAFIGTILIPAFYVIIQSLKEKVSTPKSKEVPLSQVEVTY